MTFWQRRTVLLTGASGFLGKHLYAELDRRGADVIAPRHAVFDLRDADSVRRLFMDLGSVDMVVHAAANVGGIGYNERHPARLFYDNLMMAALMLEFSYRAKVKKFIGIGTVCSYPKFTPVPFSPGSFWDGYPEETNAPYGLAKRMLVAGAAAYRAEFGFDAITVIPTNLYGDGDNFDPDSSHVIPALVRKFVDAQASGAPFVSVWGNGSATREFVHVDDAVQGILLAAEKWNHPQPLNLGSGEEVNIRVLAAKIAELVGYEGSIFYEKARPNGQPRRLVDCSELRKLGYMPRVSLEDGLRELVKSYLAERYTERIG